jgi:hypothetical protein
VTGGIIAAGEGSRLRRAGVTTPKPMVPVAGVPLIESVIRNFVAAGIHSIRIIVNESEQDCADWVRSRFSEVDADLIVKTTASSLESFLAVAAAREGGRMLGRRQVRIWLWQVGSRNSEHREVILPLELPSQWAPGDAVRVARTARLRPIGPWREVAERLIRPSGKCLARPHEM